MVKIFVFIISLLNIFPTLSFAETYSCQRERLDASGFSTKAAAESWYNKNINITTNITSKTAYYKGGNTALVIRDDNKRMKAVFKRKSSSGKRLDFTFVFLPNGEVHADLKTGGGYKSAGGAVYKCSNWYKGKIISASEPKTKSIISKRNSNTDISNYSDYLICLEAVSKTGGWEIRDTVIHYVKEAERRGLTCGVSSPKSSMSASSYSTYSDEAICNLATDKGYKTSWRTSNYGKEFVNQAKRRGLTCGIDDIEKEKQAELEREQRLKVEQEKIRTREIEKENRLKLEQEKIKKKATEVARKKRLKEEKERKKKLAQKKAKRNAEIKAQKLAEEKAKRNAEIKAQKLAEEKAKRDAEIKTQKLVEEKAKHEAEIKAQKRKELIQNYRSETSYDTMKSMKNIFEVGERYIKDHLDFKKLNKIRSNLNDLVNKPFDTFSSKEKKYFLDSYNQYNSLLFTLYNDELNSGKITKDNTFENSIDTYIINLKNEIKNFKYFIEDKKIIENFKQKFPKSEWPNSMIIYRNKKVLTFDISKIIQNFDYYTKARVSLLEDYNLNKNMWDKFIYPGHTHLKKIKRFEKEMQTWVEMGSDKFKNYYNEQKYILNNKKNLDEIKNKQKDLSIFDKLGN